MKLSEDAIKEIYEEAERDDQFFLWLMGFLDYPEEYWDDDKYDKLLFEETLELVEYLSRDEFFELGIMETDENGEVIFVRYENGFADYEKDARRYFKEQGLTGPALSWRLNVRKR